MYYEPNVSISGTSEDFVFEMEGPDTLAVAGVAFTSDAVPPPPGSPWKDIPLIDDIARDTGIGLISDLAWPWVYHFDAAVWLWFDQDNSALESAIGYDLTNGFWFWTSDAIGSWHFNLSSQDYGTSGWATWIPAGN